MINPLRCLAAACFALVVGLLPQQLLFAQDNPDQQPEVSVLPAGPIHEAYAQPALKNPQPAPIVPKKPPEPVREVPPAQKPQGENVQWIPGYWSWDAQKNDFIWVSGFWRQPPPGRKWIPGHWTQTNNGWQWAQGLWAEASRDNLQYLPQPPASLEIGPSVPAPNDNSFYVPGSWVNGGQDYGWRPGFWSPSYDDWVWNPSCYYWSPAGYVYNSGFWDFPLANRGLLFAPVFFNRPWFRRPGFFFTPNFVVNPFFASPFFSPFSRSFFFRSAFAPFFFPNFFAPPFFFPGFAPSLLSLNFFIIHPNFFSRRFVRGGFPRVNRAFRGAAPFRGFSPLTPLNQFHSNHMPLTPIGGQQLARQQAGAQSFRNASLQRSQLERPGAARGNQIPGQRFSNLPGSRAPTTAAMARSSAMGRQAFFAGPGGGTLSRPQNRGNTGSFHARPPAASFSRGGRPMGAFPFSRPAPSFRGGSPAFSGSARSFRGGMPAHFGGARSFHGGMPSHYAGARSFHGGGMSFSRGGGSFRSGGGHAGHYGGGGHHR